MRRVKLLFRNRTKKASEQKKFTMQHAGVCWLLNEMESPRTPRTIIKYEQSERCLSDISV